MNANAPKLGYVGLGNMGGPMVMRLLRAGWDVSVWGRDQAKLSPALDAGATLRDSPKDLAEAVDILFTCVSDTGAVREIVLGRNGVAEAHGAGKILIDMSTIAPDATTEMADTLLSRSGMHWIDAPVSGGTIGAEAGTLAIMAGGAEPDLERARPVLAHLGRSVTLMGPVGAGQKTKLINQTIVGCTMAVLAEALRLALNAGVDAAALPKALAGGRADSPLLQQLLPRMLAEDYTITSTIQSMMKDMNMVQALARDTGSSMPVTALVTELHRLLIQHGHSGDDVTSLYKIYGKSRID